MQWINGEERPCIILYPILPLKISFGTDTPLHYAAEWGHLSIGVPITDTMCQSVRQLAKVIAFHRNIWHFGAASQAFL